MQRRHFSRTWAVIHRLAGRDAERSSGDRAFVGDEQGFIRVIGLTGVVIGRLYVFGGRTDGRQFSVASVG